MFKYGSNTKQTYLRSDDVIGQQLIAVGVREISLNRVVFPV